MRINGGIKLCHTDQCCPIVRVREEDDMIVIRDDEGGEVKLTKEQYEILLYEGYELLK